MNREFLAWLSVFAGLFLAAICWLIAYPSYAQEQQVCGPRRQVIDSLKKHYGEEERWYGIATNKKATVYLLLVSKSGSWTMLRVHPDVACGIVSGTDFTLMFGEPA